MKKIIYFLLISLSLPIYGQTIVDIVVDSPDHETLEAAVIAAELAETLSGEGPFTVFAPTDDAFAALPAGTVESLLEEPTGALTDILLYHVVSGAALSTDLSDGMSITTINGKDVTVAIGPDGVFINNAMVTVADIEADNGVIHVIDAVLLPPVVTVVDVVVNSPDHETLEAAVIAANLAGTLSGDGPFTLFAPTDEAFAALPAGTVEALLEDPEGALTSILLYHAVSGTVLSTDLSDGMMAATINGADITVAINDEGVFINEAQVTVADIVTDNGVVHVIDAVLLPPTNTSTNELFKKEISFKAFPNPVDEELKMSFEDDLKGNELIKISDLTGTVVKQWYASSANENISLNNLSKGVYLLSVEKNKTVEVIKIVKQ